MSSNRMEQPNAVPENYVFPQNDEIQYDAELRRSLRRISTAVNNKESALYIPFEIYTGGSFIPATSNNNEGIRDRPIFRAVVNFGALPNNSTKSVAHNLSLGGNVSFLKIYGAASQLTNDNFTSAISLGNISVNPTQVMITTTSDLSAYIAFIILEYVRLT